jgi:hypothetical protein
MPGGESRWKSRCDAMLAAVIRRRRMSLSNNVAVPAVRACDAHR